MSLPQPGDATGIDWFNVVTLKLAQKIGVVLSDMVLFQCLSERFLDDVELIYL